LRIRKVMGIEADAFQPHCQGNDHPVLDLGEAQRATDAAICAVARGSPCSRCCGSAKTEGWFSYTWPRAHRLGTPRPLDLFIGIGGRFRRKRGSISRDRI
jgi:hypothetical protein